MAVIESIPNVSEGRRPDVIQRMADAIRGTPGVQLLDVSSDASHNRSVFTLVGDAASLEAATLALFEQAVAAIDLRTHRGEHPASGRGRRRALRAHRGGDDGGVRGAGEGRSVRRSPSGSACPVYLYEEAAANPARRNLEDIRRGEFEGLAAKMAAAEWAPDFGPAKPHRRRAPP